MELLLCHLVGDYVLQNQWMADNKTKSWFPAIVHALVYMIPFLFVTQSPIALLVIFGTHAVIDRYRLAKYWCQFYRIGRGAPDWLAVWLLILVDNTFHLIINYTCVTYL